MNFQNAATDNAQSWIPPDDSSGLEDAISTVEPGTGKVLAMAENRNYNAAQTDPNAQDTAVNYNVDSEYGGSTGFSPGSTFKPVILTEWLKEGHTLSETPSGLRYPFYGKYFACSKDTGAWSPKNADGSVSNGTAIYALERSLNIPFIQMGTILGLCSIFDTAKNMGYYDSLKGDVTDPSYMIPSALIGSMNTTPLTMATVYATLASGGIKCNPIAINKITDQEGTEYSVPTAGCKRVLDENIAGTMQYALKDSATRGIAKTAAVKGHDTGAKTGTSEDATHYWTCGFVKQAATAVWVGNAQYDVTISVMRIHGLYTHWYSDTLPAPLWKNYMTDALNAAGLGNEEFSKGDQSLIYGSKKVATSTTNSTTNSNSGSSTQSTTTTNNGSTTRVTTTPTTIKPSTN
jgi:membrane peptidoglycan carboxypeptidase